MHLLGLLPEQKNKESLSLGHLGVEGVAGVEGVEKALVQLAPEIHLSQLVMTSLALCLADGNVSVPK